MSYAYLEIFIRDNVIASFLLLSHTHTHTSHFWCSCNCNSLWNCLPPALRDHMTSDTESSNACS